MNSSEMTRGRALSPRAPKLMRTARRAVPAVCFLLAINSFSGASRAPSVDFQHGVTSEEKPWKHERFDAAEDKVQFALFGDLTGGERENVFDVAVEQLNLLRPELIINVGDLVEGSKHDREALHHQWDTFDARASGARAPVFYVGGNHDLTGTVSRDVWAERNGPRYYHFVYRNILFLILDTEDYTLERMNEIEAARELAVEVHKEQGAEAFEKTEYANIPERHYGAVSPEQADYFTEVIKEHPEVRWTFVLIHKCVWKKENEKQFSRVEQSLSNQPYTVFYGHTHIYGHEERQDRDYINLATTGGAQFPWGGPSMDHLTWVTVDASGVTIANLRMDGIFDKTGHLPLNGDDLEFERKMENEI